MKCLRISEESEANNDYIKLHKLIIINGDIWINQKFLLLEIYSKQLMMGIW